MKSEMTHATKLSVRIELERGQKDLDALGVERK